MLNWRSSSIDMWFHPYPSEVKDLMYDFIYFKVLHINMWHVVKHFIVLWHVTISFIMVIKLTPWFTLCLQLSINMSKPFPLKTNPIYARHIYDYDKNISMHHELFAIWCSRIDYMQCMCQHSTCTLMNTIKMNYKR